MIGYEYRLFLDYLLYLIESDSNLSVRKMIVFVHYVKTKIGVFQLAETKNLTNLFDNIF